MKRQPIILSFDDWNTLTPDRQLWAICALNDLSLMVLKWNCQAFVDQCGHVYQVKLWQELILTETPPALANLLNPFVNETLN